MPVYRKQCPHCGTVNPMDSARCSRCGQLIKRFIPVVDRAPEPIPPSTVAPSPSSRIEYRADGVSLPSVHRTGSEEGPVIYEAGPTPLKPALCYLAGIAVAELVTVMISPIGGVIFHILLLMALVYHSSRADEPANKIYLSIALAPLIRLISLAMPLANIPRIYSYGIIAIPVLLAVLVVVRRLGYTRSDISLTINRTPFQVLVALTGIPLGIAEYIILTPQPLVSESSWQAVIIPGLILLVATGYVEEMVFRGVMQRSADEALGDWGWVYIAGIFAVLHIGYLSVLDIAFVFAVGLFFGWVVKKTGSIIGVTLSHGIANIVLYLVWPFLV